jgi:hypothetical protein
MTFSCLEVLFCMILPSSLEKFLESPKTLNKPSDSDLGCDCFWQLFPNAGDGLGVKIK